MAHRAFELVEDVPYQHGVARGDLTSRVEKILAGGDCGVAAFAIRPARGSGSGPTRRGKQVS